MSKLQWPDWVHTNWYEVLPGGVCGGVYSTNWYEVLPGGFCGSVY